MSTAERDLMVKIVQYLRDVRNPAFDEESLQVAAETLQLAVGLDTVPPSSGLSLLEIFRKGTAADQQKTSSSEAEQDPELREFLEVLEKRGFFEGTSPGSPEYAGLVERAKERFQQKQKQQQQQQQQQQPTPERDPQRAADFKTQGNQLLAQGNYRGAVEAYSRAIELDNTVALYFANRAATYLKIEDWALAEADCIQAIALDPTYAKAYHRQATALERMGRTAGAVAALKQGLEKAEGPMRQEFVAAIERLESDAEPAAGGMPNLGALFGGGGGGGGFDFNALMSNPMVQQALQDPNMMNNIMGMLGGGGAGGAGGGNFNLANILNDPATMQNLGQMFGGAGDQRPPQ